MKPRFTTEDLKRQPKGGYVRVELSDVPGYLSAKFKEIRERQAAEAVTTKSKVRELKKAAR